MAKPLDQPRSSANTGRITSGAAPMPDGLLSIAHPPTPKGATTRELQIIAALHRRATVTDDAASVPAMMAGLDLIVGLIGEWGRRQSFTDQWDHNQAEGWAE